MRLLPLLTLAALVFAGTGNAHAETLTEALAQAYASNPTLKAGRLGVGVLDESVAEAVAAWRPNLSASSGPSRTASSYTASKQTTYTTLDSRQTVVQLSLRLFDFGQTNNAIKAAEERVMAGRAQLLGNEQNILLTAAQAYMDVLQAEAVVALSLKNAEVLERQLAAAEAGFQRQLSTRTDLAQAQARRANAQANLDVARESLDTARAVYETVIGRPPGPLVFPDRLPLLPASAEEAAQRALSEFPSVLAAERSVAADRANHDAVKAGLLPTITLQAQSTWATNNSVGVDEFKERKVGVQLSMPIFAGGIQQARIRGSALSLEQRLQELEAIRRDARRSALSGWNGLLSARARLSSFQSSVKANEVAYQGAQAEYQRMGTRTLLDVLNAEQELFTAQVNLAQARRDEVVAAFQVIAATGALTARKLNLAVPFYDPAPHLDQARSNWFGIRTDTE